LKGPARLLAPAVLALSLASAAAAEPVKLLKPDQYRSRVVASKKGRVLLVNFWATWCDPCREEMPALVSAAKGFRSSDVAVVLVSTDTPKTASAVPKFLSQLRVPFVCWQAKSRDPQPFIDAVDRGWDGSLPYTLVYDRKGEIVAKLAGRQTEASFSEALTKALGGPR
jgi:thiol-disulfide isomerase/thioredoxin